MQDTPLTVTQVALSDLVPDPDNARLHPEENLAAITGSLEVFGQREPLICRKADNRVIGGNGRLEAMRAMGWDTAAVTYVDCDDATATALALALNRTSDLAQWDTEKLDALLAEIGEAGYSADAIGFSDVSLEQLVADTRAATERDAQAAIDAETAAAGDEPRDPQSVDVEPIDPPEKPITQPGDLIIMGEHRLYCGNSADKADVAALMGSDKADLVFTDPPYNIAGKTTGMGATIRPRIDKLMKSEWDVQFDFKDVEANILDFCHNDVAVYVCTSHHLAGQIWAWMGEWAALFNFVVWSKSNPMPSLAKRHWTWNNELICYATRGKHTFNFPEEGHALSTWALPKITKSDLHPTMKPVSVPQRAIEHSSKEGDIVMDLFGGAGSTLLACALTKRKARLMEISPAYCDCIVKRFEDAVGIRAKRPERTSK